MIHLSDELLESALAEVENVTPQKMLSIRTKVKFWYEHCKMKFLPCLPLPYYELSTFQKW